MGQKVLPFFANYKTIELYPFRCKVTLGESFQDDQLSMWLDHAPVSPLSSVSTSCTRPGPRRKQSFPQQMWLILRVQLPNLNRIDA